MHNTKSGGFIQAILLFLATGGKFLLSSALPSLVQGALQGVGSATGSKIVDKIPGNGVVFYVKKPNGQAFKAIKAGKGLYLKAWKNGGSVGEGLYLRSLQGGYVDGSGLLLGENSPFRNIPVLGWLL